ncbi:unnamed protein product [Allacma fusca]|uniref:GH16 domain-containing protein n=1 Tax=Allacma fusca TaxID=39272 RepID=A0A8J2MBU7_9HEXA|nr:unnamed protein product [Allacma fusca]
MALVVIQFVIIVLVVFIAIFNVEAQRSRNKIQNYETKQQGQWSVTETNKGRAKKGELIFEDEFINFDLNTWQHEITAGGGGNWEFQLYHNNRSNSYVEYGKLYIKPTLTSDKYGESFLTSGILDLNGATPADSCTGAQWSGCRKEGSSVNIINPVMSARIRTVNSFSFKYGVVKVRAKLPAGDWLWPAIWLMPKNQQYGTWPASGEIDIMESRGNLNLRNARGLNIGPEQVGSTLHYGPFFPMNGWDKAHFEKNLLKDQGFDKNFHEYGLEWTPDHIKFLVDDEVIGTVAPTDKGGFWELGGFGNNVDNPWKYSENQKMAPFDQQFYLIMNLAVGGTNSYFQDNLPNSKKPWRNSSPLAALDFWNSRSDWLPTWDGENAALQVDYVRVWAL